MTYTRSDSDDSRVLLGRAPRLVGLAMIYLLVGSAGSWPHSQGEGFRPVPDGLERCSRMNAEETLREAWVEPGSRAADSGRLGLPETREKNERKVSYGHRAHESRNADEEVSDRLARRLQTDRASFGSEVHRCSYRQSSRSTPPTTRDGGRQVVSGSNE